MHKLKQIPEDFIVKEISHPIIDNNGQYAYFLLRKKNYNTLDAARKIADKLRIKEKNIGFAGSKDRNAVTEQKISVFRGKKDFENINFKDIELKYLGSGNEPISLGDLEGNEFEITIRNLSNNEASKIRNSEGKKILMPNLFGPQRFSKSNHLVGKAIIKKDFKKAVELILESNNDFSNEINEHLRKHKNDFVVALKKVPLKLVRLYVHSYQSFIFNETIRQFLGKNNKNYLKNKNIKIKNIKTPVVGFGTIFNNKKIEKIINKIMENEKITPRDFIIKAIPELSQEGAERKLFIQNKGFKVIELDKDELNKDRNKIKISFSLPKGSYATVFVENLFRS
ncbi:tRNA pseudouridine(13) synthase TruD [Candidatus Woesearchaeota archaeon]|nr:tRNA pseudouridine(13) synthase TruD [Candidatus Woesearchaeota archaeon]